MCSTFPGTEQTTDLEEMLSLLDRPWLNRALHQSNKVAVDGNESILQVDRLSEVAGRANPLLSSAHPTSRRRVLTGTALGLLVAAPARSAAPGESLPHVPHRRSRVSTLYSVAACRPSLLVTPCSCSASTTSRGMPSRRTFTRAPRSCTSRPAPMATPTCRGTPSSLVASAPPPPPATPPLRPRRRSRCQWGPRSCCTRATPCSRTGG